MGHSLKPLFIPLKTEFFRAFESGAKIVEYRAYGPRWNERTCMPGRSVVLSHGYSGDRIKAMIVRLVVLPIDKPPDIARTFFPQATHIAAIHLRLARRQI